MTLSRDADVGQPDGLPGREVEQLGGSRGRLQMLFVSGGEPFEMRSSVKALLNGTDCGWACLGSI